MASGSPAPLGPCDSPPPTLGAEAFSQITGRLGDVFRQLSPHPHAAKGNQRPFESGSAPTVRSCFEPNLHLQVPVTCSTHTARAPRSWGRSGLPGQQPCPFNGQESLAHPPGSFPAHQHTSFAACRSRFLNLGMGVREPSFGAPEGGFVTTSSTWALLFAFCLSPCPAAPELISTAKISLFD